MSRQTRWGHETITYNGSRPERYLTVSSRQGVRVWAFRLPAGAAGRIAPGRILDASGSDITPGDVRWSVRPSKDGWLVQLRIVDAKLPLPYVVKPPVPRGAVP